MITLKRTIIGLTAILFMSTASHAETTISKHDTSSLNALSWGSGGGGRR